MLPVADGEAVSAFVGEWVAEASPGVVAVPFDPPLSFPIDLATSLPATDGADLLVETALRLRDAEGWLTQPAGANRAAGRLSRTGSGSRPRSDFLIRSDAA